jgi:hypothetical protein
MIAEGLPSFSIMVLRAGVVWEVLPPHEAYKDYRLLKPVDDAARTMRLRIRHLLQAVDWRGRPTWWMEFARERCHAITDTEKDMHMLGERIFDRYGRLEARLQQAVRSGQTIRSMQDLMS